MMISMNNYNIEVIPAKDGGIWIRSKDVMHILGFKNKGASLSQYIARYGFKDAKAEGTKKVGRLLYIKDKLLYSVLTAWAKCPTTSRPWATAAASFAMSLLDMNNTGPKPKDWHKNNDQIMVLNPDVNEFPTYNHNPKKAKVIGFNDKIVLENLRKAEEQIKRLERAIAVRVKEISTLQREVKNKPAEITDEKMARLFSTIKDMSQNGNIPHLQFRHTVWTLIEHLVTKGEVKILPMTNLG